MSAGKRPRRYREAPELGAAVRRFGRALVRRASGGELEALTELRACRRALDVMIREATRASVDAGYTYAEIAQECRVSPQAIFKAAERADQERKSA